MPSLVISQDTVTVNLHSRHLELIKRKTPDDTSTYEKMKVPLIDVDRVIICGRPAISIPVLQKLMKLGIPTFFLTSHGRWIGSISPDNNMNAARRIKQYEFAANGTFCIKLTQKLVYAKIRNSRRVLQRLAANRQISHYQSHSKAIESLIDLANSSLEIENIDKLRGCEGFSAAIYFEQLKNYFPPNIPFKNRTRRPPRDPANALLSWTYTIVQGEIDGIVRAHGLDACIGFMHAISHGTPALTLDLLEPLRAPCCDMLVLNILNHKHLNENDFEYHDDDGGTYLKQDSRKRFFESYEMAMTRKFTPYKGGNHIDFRGIIKESVINILKAMENNFDWNFFIMP